MKEALNKQIKNEMKEERRIIIKEQYVKKTKNKERKAKRQFKQLEKQ